MEASKPLTIPIYKPKAPVTFKFEIVQVARGVAAMMVVLYHCNSATLHFFDFTPLYGISRFGLFGVDFFFVLSGFIITYMHLNDLRKKSDLTIFIKKRFIRIYPIYWVIALLTLLYVIVVHKSRLPYTGHVLNPYTPADWVYIIKSVLLIPQQAIGLVDVSWTLSFEVLFYIVFAICISIGWKAATCIFFGWIAVIILSSTGIMGTQNGFVNFLVSTNILEFLAGCLLAYTVRSEKVRLTVPLFAVLASAIGIGSFLYLKVYQHQLNRSLTDMMLIISASALILWAAATIDKRKKKFLSAPMKKLLLVGDASYSIYLTHTMLIEVIYLLLSRFLLSSNISVGQPGANILFLLCVSLTVLIGVLCHLYVEKPLVTYLNGKYIPERRAAVNVISSAKEKAALS